MNFFCSSRCTRGELHKSLYLVQSQGGRLRQICVPQAWQERVRQAVSDYRKMQEPIEEVSELSGNDLKKGIANRSPPPDPLRRKDLLPLRDAAGAPGRLQTRAAAFHPRRGQSYSDHVLDAPAQPQRALAQISAPRASGYSDARVFDLELLRQNSSPASRALLGSRICQRTVSLRVARLSIWWQWHLGAHRILRWR